MSEFEDTPKAKKALRKITPQRLKNIALYYLKRFESSVDNLRQVLRRRVNDYARQTPDFNKHEAYQWIEDILADCQRLRYLDDDRYARLKVQNYLAAGKPARYIKTKLCQKGIGAEEIDRLVNEAEYDPVEMAYKTARKKRIGPFRPDEESRRENRQKDMAALIRAGFDYDVVCQVLGAEFLPEDENF